MDLPVEERTVEIYTYISRFSDEQIAKKGVDGEIPLTIQNNDVDIDPVSETERLMTSDEKVWNVAIRKEAISQKILKLIKEVAVDCKFNVADNEPLQCLAVKGTADQYMFDPDLEQDKITTAAEFGAATTREVVEPTVTAALAQKISITVNGEKITFLVGEMDDNRRAFIYDEKDLARKTPLGTVTKMPSKSGWGKLTLLK
jgi:hypothetical protein